MVIVYSTTWCGFCKMAKKYLSELGVDYVEKDVEQDPKAGMEAIEKSGQMGVPVIDINGTIILGFDRLMIDRALTANKLV